MRDVSTKIDPKWAWEPYRPSDKSPWDARKVGHLYRRAAFGATLAELEAGVKDGPTKALQVLLDGGPGLAEFDARMRPLAEALARSNNGPALRAWWLSRMLYTPHPLQEKLTLFWHNHFATSNAKVRSARFMLGQYERMRKQALGDFATLLKEMSSDPAMLVWLDGAGSRKGSPNENYARELMELFSLGIGHYTEQDIREAAKAFTGWEVTPAGAEFRPNGHDAGEKAVLGKRGAWKPDDVVRICLDQPSCAGFVCGKLVRFLVSDTLPLTKELLDPLAAEFRKGWDFGAVVKRALASNLFFSEHAYRAKVKGPVDFALGIVKGMEGRIGTTALAQALEQLGQNVFYPPSVKGWDGGQAWLNGQTLLFRQNLALAFCSTEDGRFGTKVDPAALAKKHGKAGDAELVELYLKVFLQGDVPAASRERLLDYARSADRTKKPAFWSEEDAKDHRARTLCHLVLSLPEFQLD